MTHPSGWFAVGATHESVHRRDRGSRCVISKVVVKGVTVGEDDTCAPVGQRMDFPPVTVPHRADGRFGAACMGVGCVTLILWFGLV